MVTEAKSKRLEALSAEMFRTARDTKPDDSELHLWEPVVNLDTE